MRRMLTLSILIVVSVLSWQLFQLYRQNRSFSAVLVNLNERVDNFTKENKELYADIQYFSEPENLLKELRTQFNYKKPGEKLIIVVPKKDSGASTTSP